MRVADRRSRPRSAIMSPRRLPRASLRDRVRNSTAARLLCTRDDSVHIRTCVDGGPERQVQKIARDTDPRRAIRHRRGSSPAKARSPRNLESKAFKIANVANGAGKEPPKPASKNRRLKPAAAFLHATERHAARHEEAEVELLHQLRCVNGKISGALLTTTNLRLATTSPRRHGR
jgi:hypothetical protein